MPQDAALHLELAGAEQGHPAVIGPVAVGRPDLAAAIGPVALRLHVPDHAAADMFIARRRGRDGAVGPDRAFDDAANLGPAGADADEQIAALIAWLGAPQPGHRIGGGGQRGGAGQNGGNGDMSHGFLPGLCLAAFWPSLGDGPERREER
jgi:hypothetical protein